MQHKWKFPMQAIEPIWNECTCGFIADTPQQIATHEKVAKRYRRRVKKRRKTHRGGMGYVDH